MNRLERSYGRWLRVYPKRWRQERSDEVVGVLLDQAEAEGRTRVGSLDAVDLVGHGLEERGEQLLGRVPRRFRSEVVWATLAVGAGLGLVLLVAEIVGARLRPPAGQTPPFDTFLSGPFLTIGVGIYLGWIGAALLVVVGRSGLARLLLVATSVYALALAGPVGDAGYPIPRLLVVGLFLALGVLATSTTLQPTCRERHRLAGATLAVAGLLTVAVSVVSEPWSWDFFTSGGYDAWSIRLLSIGLGGVMVVGLAAAWVAGRREPGWRSSALVPVLPVIGFLAFSEAFRTGPNGSDWLAAPVVYGAVLLIVGSYRLGKRSAARARTSV